MRRTVLPTAQVGQVPLNHTEIKTTYNHFKPFPGLTGACRPVSGESTNVSKESFENCWNCIVYRLELCLVSTTPLLFFHCRCTVPVNRCRFHAPLPLPLHISMPWLVGINDWLAATEQRQQKIELDPISTEERLWQLFAVHGCNGT